MTRIKKLSCAAIILTFLFTATGCGNNKNVNNVRIGYFPNMTHGQALIGIAGGAFENAFGDEYNLTFTSFNAGPSEIEAFFAGELDIGYIGPIPAVNGCARSRGDIKIIAGVSNAGAVLITRKDCVLSDVSELAGKTVAVPQFGNTQHLTLLAVLSANGLKTADKGGTVTVIESANADTKTLMDKGEIDAACVPEPWGTRLVEEIDANILLDYDKLLLDGNYSTAVVIADSKFLEDHPDLVEKFLRVHIDLTEEINNNKEESKIAINDKIYDLTSAKLEKNTLDTAFNKIIFSYAPAVPSIQNFINIYVDEVYKEKINADELFDFSILNKILAEKNLQEVK